MAFRAFRLLKHFRNGGLGDLHFLQIQSAVGKLAKVEDMLAA